MTVPIVIFDGECGVCNRLVRQLIRFDRFGVFKICGGNSEVGRLLVDRSGLPENITQKSLVVVHGSQSWTESCAVFKILSLLPFPLSVLAAGRWIPKSWRDAMYRFVARHRRKLKDADPVCGMPPPALKEAWMARVVDTPQRLAEFDNVEEYEFEFAPKYRQLLKVWGVHPSRAFVRLDEHYLLAHFGPLWVQTLTSNIKAFKRTGPYRGYRAIGFRESWVDHGLTFGSTTEGGVCICFESPIKGLGYKPRHPGLTVTVKDRDRLVEQLHELTGREEKRP